MSVHEVPLGLGALDDDLEEEDLWPCIKCESQSEREREIGKCFGTRDVLLVVTWRKRRAWSCLWMTFCAGRRRQELLECV